ncbi:Uncharacterised protein [Capnocytophaga ochracea]|uniref:Uncharacterized protein n=1 Tax=Capnocytophaga ochracea TaxID=1018 RepID=A0A2X2SQA6_CAPOC|nr:Uncharacterised protein [Capnocytophaga ochracea]
MKSLKILIITSAKYKKEYQVSKFWLARTCKL